MASSVLPDLTLIVPGLFGPVPPAGVNRRAARGSLVEGLALGEIETLLSRAQRIAVEHACTSPEDLCFGVMGYHKEAGSDWPVAAVTRHADVGDGMPGWVLRADPVHLKADMSDLVMFDGGHFNLDLDEARELARIVAANFEHENWRFEVPHPLRWYLHLERPPKITTAPLSAAVLKPVAPHLPAGSEASLWRIRMNEIQMILHGCDINHARESRGEVPVNSLWFWGGGILPEPLPAVYSSVFSDDVLAAGLGALGGIRSCPLPSGGAAGVLAEAAAEPILVVISQGWTPARSSDIDAWRRFLEELEQSWFAPLKAALDSGALGSLSLICDHPVRFDVRPARWWRRLRRPRSFADLAET